MDQDHPIDSARLLTCFFAACENMFGFLERRYDYSYYAGLATYAGGRQIIRPYHAESVATPFVAVTRYEDRYRAIEIVYGDSGFSIDVYFYPDRIHRFTLSEMLRAAKKTKSAAEKTKGLLSAEAIEHKIKEIAHILDVQSHYLIEAQDEMAERAAILRAKEMEKNIRAQFHRDLKTNLRHAAQAFTTQNYKAVIVLLMPYERYLKKGDLKKLEIARESLIH